MIQAQAAVRGFLARQQLRKENEAATKIQACIRSYLAHKRFLCLRLTAMRMQRRYRHRKLARITREIFLIKRSAAVTLQAATRGFLARRELKHRHAAAAKIQAGVRCWIVQQRYARMRQSIMVLQAHWRATIAMWHQHKAYHILRGAAICTQAAWKGLVVRRRIQTWRKAATIIQANTRGFLQRQQYSRMRVSAVLVQQWWHGILHTRYCRLEFLAKRDSALILQAAVRGLLVRRRLQKMRQAAVTLQRHWRKRTVHRKKVAATLEKEREEHRRKVEAVLVLQRRWRSACLALRTQEYFIYLRRAAVILQAAWRGRQARVMVRRMKAATTIQVLRTLYCNLTFLYVSLLTGSDFLFYMVVLTYWI